MRVVGVAEFEGPASLKVWDVAAPPLRPGHVRIRVKAAAVNPTDTYIWTGARAKALLASGPPPYVPGMDAAGVLAEIAGDLVTDLSVGDRVMAIVVPSGGHGAYAEEIVVPVESVVRMPAGTDFVEAATVPMNGLTARMALDLMGLSPGQTLAVTGAAGAFGGYTVQLARAEGHTVVADASASDEPLVRQLGADVVVRRGDDVAARIREHVPEGVEAVADGAVMDNLILPAVTDGGVVTTVRYLKGEAERNIRFIPVRVSHYYKEQSRLEGLKGQVEEGLLTPRVARTFPAEAAADAHRMLVRGGVRGRLVLVF